MDEFAVEVTAKGADGSHDPFQIYVGAPEKIDDAMSESHTWCSLLEKPTRIRGANPAQSYHLAFRFIGRLVEYSGLTLLATDGTPFHLPDPPDGCEEEE